MSHRARRAMQTLTLEILRSTLPQLVPEAAGQDQDQDNEYNLAPRIIVSTL